MVCLDNLHSIQHLWLMGSPWGLPFLHPLPLPLPPLVRMSVGRKKADTVICLVSPMIRVVGLGEALATDKNPLKCTLKSQVGAANAFAMDNSTACKSQNLLRQADPGCAGQPRVNLLGKQHA